MCANIVMLCAFCQDNCSYVSDLNAEPQGRSQSFREINGEVPGANLLVAVLAASTLGDNDLHADIAKVFNVVRICAGISDQNIDVCYRPDESETLPTEFGVVRERDAGLCRLRDHSGYLRFCVVRSGNSVFRIDCADSQNGLVQSDFRQCALGPFTGEVKGIFLQIAACAHDCHACAALQFANYGRRIRDNCKSMAVDKPPRELEHSCAAFEKNRISV